MSSQLLPWVDVATIRRLVYFYQCREQYRAEGVSIPSYLSTADGRSSDLSNDSMVCGS